MENKSILLNNNIKIKYFSDVTLENTSIIYESLKVLILVIS
jgi:hypothetical protein